MPRLRDAESQRLYGDAISSLNALKGTLDSATLVSEQIKERLERLRSVQPPGPWFAGSAALLRRYVRHPDEDAIPVELQSEYHDVEEAVGRAFDLVAQARKQEHHKPAAIAALSASVDGILAFERIYIEADRSRYAEDYNTQYLLGMDRALCLFWQARLTWGVERKDRDRATSQLLEAVAIYQRLKAPDSLATRAMLHFRLGHAYLTGDDFDSAIQSLRTAVDLLATDRSLPRDDVYRCEIPKLLGFAYWLKLQQVDGSDPIELLVAACDATAHCFHGFRSIEVTDPDLLESGKLALHNYLSYCVEMYALHDRELGLSLLRDAPVDVDTMLGVFGLRRAVTDAGDVPYRRIQQTLIVYDLMCDRTSSEDAAARLARHNEELRRARDADIDEEIRRGEALLTGISSGAMSTA
jgi:tetratricopeptide (TPR) repeat protein